MGIVISNPLNEIIAPRGLFDEPPPTRKNCRWCDSPLENGRCRSRCRQPEVMVVHSEGCKPVAIRGLGCLGDVAARIMYFLSEIPNAILWRILLLCALLAKMRWHWLDYAIWKNAANLSKSYRRIVNATRKGVAEDEPVLHNALAELLQFDKDRPLSNVTRGTAGNKCVRQDERVFTTTPTKITMPVRKGSKGLIDKRLQIQNSGVSVHELAEIPIKIRFV